MKFLFVLCLAAFALAVPHTISKQCEPPPDPSIIEPKDNLNFTLHPIFRLDPGSVHNGGFSAGHTTAETHIEINLLILAATVITNIPSIELSLNEVSATGYLDFSPFTSIPSGNFSATSSDLTISVTGFEARSWVYLFINLITNKVTIRLLELQSVKFDTICVKLSDTFLIGGSPVDWDNLCTTFKDDFMAEFNDSGKNIAFTERLRGALNNPVGNCLIDELVACAENHNECREQQDPRSCQCLLDMIFIP